MIAFLAFAIFLQGALGELVCEELPVDMCSFTIASSGKRCLLETFEFSNSGNHVVQCKTSEVIAMNMLSEHIETDECIRACGVDRSSVGISSDALMETQFIPKLCSSECYFNCPNIVDLYYHLAMAEGVHLPKLCDHHRSSSRRSIIQLKSSSAAAHAPISATAYAPISATAYGPSSATAYGPSSSEALSAYGFAPAPM